jgi:hypothetical protein
VDGGNVLVGFRGGEVKDGVLHNEGNPMVATAQSLASLVNVEVRPEMWARRVMARCSICCETKQGKNVRGGARERGR